MMKTNKISGGENLEHDKEAVGCLTMIQASLVLYYLTNVSIHFDKIYAD